MSYSRTSILYIWIEKIFRKSQSSLLDNKIEQTGSVPTEQTLPNLNSWLETDLADMLEEEAELVDGSELFSKMVNLYQDMHPDRINNRSYFRSLFALQAELIKLQEWVVHHNKKVVVLFEGRDSAGKGGVIKRITQRLNPRVVRVVALPAPSDREREVVRLI